MRRALWPDSAESEIDDVPTDGEHGIVLVAEGPDGRLAGFAEIALRAYAAECLTSPVAYLEGIWIDVDARRAGVATALVREAEAWARGRGLTEFASDCDLTNEASRAFHAAVGFTEVGPIICFRRNIAAGSG